MRASVYVGSLGLTILRAALAPNTPTTHSFRLRGPGAARTLPARSETTKRAVCMLGRASRARAREVRATAGGGSGEVLVCARSQGDGSGWLRLHLISRLLFSTGCGLYRSLTDVATRGAGALVEKNSVGDRPSLFLPRVQTPPPGSYDDLKSPSHRRDPNRPVLITSGHDKFSYSTPQFY